MFKQILLASILLAGIPAMAMERIKDVSIEEVDHSIEEQVKLLLKDNIDNVTHVVKVPMRFAKLIGSLLPLLESTEFELKGAGFPLPLVRIDHWRFIEKQLERVYGIVHDYENAVQLRGEIISECSKLASITLVGLIKTLDYIDMPVLLEVLAESLLRCSQKDISYEDVSSLPGDLGNRFIVHTIRSLVGALPSREVVVVRRGLEGIIFSVCVTLDDKHIVLGLSDGTVRVCDLEGNKVAVCRGHEGFVGSVCVTPDGKHIVSGSWDGTVRVWDMQGNEVVVCGGHGHKVTSVCVTPDGKYIVSGSEDNTVRVWDMQGHEVVVCRGHGNKVTLVCVTPDGKHIVSGSWDGTVRVWDMQGNEVVVCRGHEKAVNSVCVTPDGKHIVSGSEDNTVRVWDMQGHEVVVCRGHEKAVNSVCVTPDGKYIASGSMDGTVRVWDMQGHEVAVCKGSLEGSVTSVCVTSDGNIVSGSWSKTVRVWDIGLLDRILHADADQARALWNYLIKLPQVPDQGKCWEKIEAIMTAKPLCFLSCIIA